MRGPTFMAVEKVVDIRHASTAADCRAAGCTQDPVYDFSVVLQGTTKTVLTCRHHGKGPAPEKLAIPEATRILWVDEEDAFLVCGWHYRAKKSDRYTGDRTKPRQVELQNHLEDRLDHGGICELCRCDIEGDADTGSGEDDESEMVVADGGTGLDSRSPTDQDAGPAGVGDKTDASEPDHPVTDADDHSSRTDAEPADRYNQDAVDETTCAYCEAEFDTQTDLTDHQKASKCIIAKLDYSPTEVREIAAEASTLLELQQDLRMSREQVRHLLRGAGCYDQFKNSPNGPIPGNDTDADEGVDD